MSRMLEQLEQWWKAEAPRRFLFLPVCFAAGIASYYALPFEPPAFLLPLMALVMVGMAWLFYRRAKGLMVAATLIMFGAAWANLMTPHDPSTVLGEALTPRPILGVVREIQRTEHGVRLTLDTVTIDDLPSEKTPRRMRISVRLKADSTLALPEIGDAITIRAGLLPPMGPALPHGFNFARYFSLRGIGAVGYGLPPWQVVARDETPSLANDFRNWRVRLSEEIIHIVGPASGAVAAGLITGDAKAISDADFDALRASNLYHIIAISGEHMVVIAGVVFISLRLLALLVLPRHLRLRPGVKSLAAAVTLVLITAYLFVTGLPVSAVRAYVMILLVLLAVIVRRQVDAMRSLALAAFAMLLYHPGDILDPGFQLSFAATIAIIALVESRLLVRRPEIERGPLRNALHLLVTMLLVSVVAEAATAPFVVAMFNNLSLYGVFANMLATPLVSLFLMPVVALFFILLPLGLHSYALWLMDFGIRALLGLAHWISGFPYAQFFLPSIPGYGVALFALGLLWLCLWQTRARRWGIAAMLLGVATITFNHPPDLLVGSSLKQIALRSNDQGFVLARGRVTSMLPELWANGLGFKELPKAGAPAWRCDALGCVARVKGQVIAFPTDATALAEDCRHAALVVTTLSHATCANGRPVIGAETLAKSNVTAFWIGDAIRHESSADWQGKRPWNAVAEDEPEEGESL